MNKQGKFWGNTTSLFNRNNVEVHRIEGRKGGYSSEHRHIAKFNMFYVDGGVITLRVWKDPSGKVDETILRKGEMSIVAPGYFHKFEVIKDCVVYEVYWVELNESDIERRVCGGTSSKNNP